MAEATADVVCRRLGVEAPCRTREQVLLPHTAYYTSHESMRSTTRRTPAAPAATTGGAATTGTTGTSATTAASSRVLRVSRWKPGWPAPAQARVRRPRRAAHHRARRAAQHQVARRPVVDRAALVLPLVVRHVRRAGERGGGARLRHRAGRPAGGPGDGRADGQRAGAQRPGGRHDPAVRRARTVRTSAGAAGRDDGADAQGADPHVRDGSGVGAARGLRRVRAVRLRLPDHRDRPGLSRPRRARRGRPGGRRAAWSGRAVGAHVGGRPRRLLAVPPQASHAARSAPRGRTRPPGSWRCAAPSPGST